MGLHRRRAIDGPRVPTPEKAAVTNLLPHIAYGRSSILVLKLSPEFNFRVSLINKSVSYDLSTIKTFHFPSSKRF